MRFTVDAIQDTTARLEESEGHSFTVPTAWLPPHAKEGDVLHVAIATATEGVSERTIRFTLDHAAADEARSRVQSKLDRLRGRA